MTSFGDYLNNIHIREGSARSMTTKQSLFPYVTRSRQIDLPSLTELLKGLLTASVLITSRLAVAGSSHGQCNSLYACIVRRVTRDEAIDCFTSVAIGLTESLSRC